MPAIITRGALSARGFGFCGKIRLPQPPANISAPTISGTTAAGNTLACSLGSWTDNPINYTYQWYRSGSLVTGATMPYYTLSNNDVATTLKCLITAYNNIGNGSAYSANTASITSSSVINFADAFIPGVKIGVTSVGPSEYAQDQYCGPNCYNLHMSYDSAYQAVGALISYPASPSTTARSDKTNYIATTFTGGGSSSSPFNIVIDLGESRTFTNARYYQTFADGKTTHAALDYSTTLQTRTGTWTQAHAFTALDNSSTSTGVQATFSSKTARYVRVRLYNDGSFGNSTYTELFGFKLFA